MGMTPMVKIVVQTDGGEWHGMTYETLWGSPINDMNFRIENAPLYAYGISYHDIARCSRLDDGLYRFNFAVVKGGHSNYRLLLRKGKNPSDFLSRWDRLQRLGCVYESSKDPEDVFAIDVPPHVDVYAVFDVLDQGEKDGIWHLDEGNFEHAART